MHSAPLAVIGLDAADLLDDWLTGRVVASSALSAGLFLFVFIVSLGLVDHILNFDVVHTLTLFFFVSDAMSLPRSTHKYKLLVMKLGLNSATLFENQSLQVATTPNRHPP